MAAASLRPKFGRPASTQDVVRALRNALGQLSLDRGAPASPEGAVLKDRLQKAVSNYAQPEQKMKELWRHVNAARKEVGRLAEPGASRGALRAAQRRLIELQALAYALHSKRQGQLEADLKEVYAAAAKVADRVCLDFELERALPGLTEDEKRYYRAMSELRREKAARMARVASDACRPYDAATVVSKLGKEATAKILIKEAAKADVELLTDVSLSECVHVLRVVAALDEQGASALLEHSADPPDPRYRRLARAPKVFTVKVTGRGRSARAFAAWSRLLSNLGQQSARALGLLTAIERAQGAALAGDDAWLRRHESAGRTLALRWAALVKDEHRLRKRAARAFRKLPRRRALGVRNQRLLLAGNPTGRARRLIARSTGLDLWRELGAHAFGRGSGQQLPAAIAASPRETRVLRRVERSLQRLARRLG